MDATSGSEPAPTGGEGHHVGSGGTERRGRGFKRKRNRKKPKKRKTCYDWLAGTCKRGDLCRYSHSMPEKSEQRLESDKLLRNQAGSRQTPSQRMHAGFVKADGFGGGSKPVFGSVVERYYTQMFKVDHAGRDHHDHFAYMHSNRMCITGLAPSHELITAHATNPVKSVSFQIHARGRVTRDLTVLQFSGKRKKGTPTVEGPTTICQVTMTDGRVYNIPATIPGRVLEVNLKLVDDPTLLVRKPLTTGYIALIDPKASKVAMIQRSLLTKAEYDALRGDEHSPSGAVPCASAMTTKAEKLAKAQPPAAPDATTTTAAASECESNPLDSSQRSSGGCAESGSGGAEKAGAAGSAPPPVPAEGGTEGAGDVIMATEQASQAVDGVEAVPSATAVP